MKSKEARKKVMKSLTKNDIDMISDQLLKQRGMDISGYSHSLVECQINQRLDDTNTITIPKYCEFLLFHPDEIDNLIDILIINVSHFFRDPLVFNYLSSKILPKLLLKKQSSQNNPLRIWSAGCSAGEEPFSLAMDIHKLVKNLYPGLTVNIFATDFDSHAIDKACEARYTNKGIDNVRFEYLKHFSQKTTTYTVKQNIKQLVDFSIYDLLDKRSFSPPQSLYGGFDIVLCRNVLIYYDTDSQNKILNKLYRSLNEDGFLILGETETPTRRFHDYFQKITRSCQIYIKNSTGDK
jgi:chemotaxis protein methyltransferase CheR